MPLSEGQQIWDWNLATNGDTMANRNKRVMEEPPEPPIVEQAISVPSLRTVFIHVDKMIFFPSTTVVRPGVKEWFSKEISPHDVVILVTSRRPSHSRSDEVSAARTLDALRELNRQKVLHWDEFICDCQGELKVYEKTPG